MNRNDKIKAIEQALAGNASTLQKYQESKVIYSYVLENSLLCKHEGSHPEAVVTIERHGSNFHVQSSHPQLNSIVGVHKTPEIEMPLFV
jgi:hypothetical protein